MSSVKKYCISCLSREIKKTLYAYIKVYDTHCIHVFMAHIKLFILICNNTLSKLQISDTNIREQSFHDFWSLCRVEYLRNICLKSCYVFIFPYTVVCCSGLDNSPCLSLSCKHLNTYSSLSSTLSFSHTHTHSGNILLTHSSDQINLTSFVSQQGMWPTMIRLNPRAVRQLHTDTHTCLEVVIDETLCLLCLANL